MPEADREYPRLFPKPEQTIAGIGRAIREGRVTCVDVLNRCFEQVDHWEPKVHAWVVLDREGAIEQARVARRRVEGRQGSRPAPWHPDRDQGPLRREGTAHRLRCEAMGRSDCRGTMPRLSHGSARRAP